ncbi:MAG: transcription termination/antitermination protein NusG [Bacilli bacterium]|nr:transcription termination/antitermination protein NusG [Bacilli bacterium]MDD2681699.1 transcription termination/antitermination protein NusG [Bacilli bacterium]MDD3121550.1 transcription termination/antitermination protein NusG [Bacilli bacterium]MDD4062821.1 transcription termination/antitermination protein NusG [Bacilli bacterium]MDD4482224.1 transcription termination/antitermination protein NusG [Bacilli bacterium]
MMTERAWYVVQTYSGCESAAKNNIELRAESMNMQDIIFNVIVPEEVHMEKKKNGELKEVFVKPFPGYVFIDMIVTDESWFMIRNTPMVTGFLGSSGGGAKPVPVQNEEMESILKIAGLTKKSSFSGKIGDKVKIIAGNFSGQYGIIDFIDEQKRVVKVLIDFFGRQTPAELSFDEIVL